MHTGFLRTYVLREGYATRIPFRQASTVRGFGFVFYPFPRAYALGSIEFFWYIALVRCTIEHNGEGTKGSPPIVPEERRRPNPGLGLYPKNSQGPLSSRFSTAPCTVSNS